LPSSRDVIYYRKDYKLIYLILLILFNTSNAFAYTDKQAIQAIIGEAEGEHYTGMYAVACAIRNRHTLHGVHGYHAYRVRHRLYSTHIWKEATIAWASSLHGYDTTHGSIGWGSPNDYLLWKRNGYYKKIKTTTMIGTHLFYKPIDN
jgi:spore germination cell wall hydrolase CwlJ-like protein